MEDEHYVADSGNFFAVFDGHGGGDVSEYLREHFWDAVLKRVRAQPSFLGMGDFHGKDLPKAFREACASVQKIIAGVRKFDHVGSTAICVLLDANCIWSINVGDSRAVLSRAGRAVDLSTDHKPNTKAEQERIEKVGGKVSWFGWEDEEGEPVAGMGAWRVNGNLGVSRSFGDRLEFPYVIADPTVEMIEVRERLAWRVGFFFFSSSFVLPTHARARARDCCCSCLAFDSHAFFLFLYPHVHRS